MTKMIRGHGNRILFSLALLAGAATTAQADPQRCRPQYEQAFSTLVGRDFRTIEKETSPADLQVKLDAEIYVLFGDRQQVCEEGAYALFLDRFSRYTIDALHAPRDERNGKLRAAIAAFQKSPQTIDSVAASTEAAQFRPTFWNIRQVAQEVGMPPLARQLLDTMESVGPPAPAPAGARRVDPGQLDRRPEPAATPVRPRTDSAPTAPADPYVQKVYVPTEPLPAWAVISLYEIEQAARRGDMATVLPKIQAVLQWIKAAAPPPPQQ